MAASYFGENFGQGPSILAIPPPPGRPSRTNGGDCKGGRGYISQGSSSASAKGGHDNVTEDPFALTLLLCGLCLAV